MLHHVKTCFMRHKTAYCLALLLSLFFGFASVAQAVAGVTVGSSRQIRTTKSGNKVDVLKTELLRFNICPTRGTLDLLEKLNPQLKTDTSVAEGTSVILPLLNDVDDAVQQKMTAFLADDNAVSKTGNALLLKNSKALRTVLTPWLKNRPDSSPWMIELRDINLLLQKITGQKTPVLRKYHTDILNSEIERFTRYLSGQPAKRPPVGFDTAYVRSFRDYFYQVAGPYYSVLPSMGMRSMRTGGSGLAAVKPARFLFNGHLPDDAATAVDVWIHVLVPVLMQSKFKYIDSMNQYWVYCLSQFQFDNLNQKLAAMTPTEKRTLAVDRLRTFITVADLERVRALCPSPASVTAKRIDTRFAYHFIVVSLNKKNILIHDWLDLAKYSFQLQDGKYGLGLYQNINWAP